MAFEKLLRQVLPSYEFQGGMRRIIKETHLVDPSRGNLSGGATLRWVCVKGYTWIRQWPSNTGECGFATMRFMVSKFGHARMEVGRTKSALNDRVNSDDQMRCNMM